MAIEVNERWSDQQDGGEDATRVFEVTNALSTSHARIAQGSNGINVPRRGDPHPYRPGLWAQEPVATREGFYFYVVRVAYGLNRFTGDGDDPLSQPVRWRWQFSLESVEVDTDKDGNPIVNSAGQAFDPPPQSTESVIQLFAKKNQPFFDVQQAVDFNNTTNSGPVVIPAAGQVLASQMKCVGINPTQEYTVDVDYVEVEYSFELSPLDLGIVRVLDKGPRAVITQDADPQDVTDLFPGDDPHLDGRGHLLPKFADMAGVSSISDNRTPPDGAVLEIPPGILFPAPGDIDNTVDAVWLRYRRLKQKDFALLGIF